MEEALCVGLKTMQGNLITGKIRVLETIFISTHAGKRVVKSAHLCRGSA